MCGGWFEVKAEKQTTGRWFDKRTSLCLGVGGQLGYWSHKLCSGLGTDPFDFSQSALRTFLPEELLEASDLGFAHPEFQQVLVIHVLELSDGRHLEKNDCHVSHLIYSRAHWTGPGTRFEPFWEARAIQRASRLWKTGVVFSRGISNGTPRCHVCSWDGVSTPRVCLSIPEMVSRASLASAPEGSGLRPVHRVRLHIQIWWHTTTVSGGRVLVCVGVRCTTAPRRPYLEVGAEAVVVLLQLGAQQELVQVLHWRRHRVLLVCWAGRVFTSVKEAAGHQGSWQRSLDSEAFLGMFHKFTTFAPTIFVWLSRCGQV